MLFHFDRWKQVIISSNMASKPSCFDPRNLPVLVAENIASHLNGLDLINLGLTCKFWYEIATNNSVWKVLSKKRFGKLVSDDGSNENFKKLYFVLGRTKMPVADFYYILHLGDRYLKKITDPDSSFGYVIYLKTVCWLQINGKFNSVFPGKYRLLWRMKLENPYMNSSGEACIWYKANPSDGCGAVFSCRLDERKVQKLEKQYGKNCWFVYDAGELTIESMCDVCVEIHGRNDYWCGGFYWDYVQMKLVGGKKSGGGQKDMLDTKGSCEVM